MKSIFDQLQILSPLACRMLARERIKNGIRMRALTNQEIADRSGLPIARIRWLVGRTSWESVQITPPDLAAYLAGCGITQKNMSAQIRYLVRSSRKSPPMPHLSDLGPKMRKRIYGNQKSTNHNT